MRQFKHGDLVYAPANRLKTKYRKAMVSTESTQDGHAIVRWLGPNGERPTSVLNFGGRWADKTDLMTEEEWILSEALQGRAPEKTFQ